jgi:hypothetical protein
MGLSVFPAPSGGKTMFRTTLTSGTSYTVPAGVNYLNVTLVGGGGGGGGGSFTSPFYEQPIKGLGGQIISSTLSVTPGASIVYAIGAGGSAGPNGMSVGAGGTGGTTTFTGATSASGGGGGKGANASGGQGGTAYQGADNGGNPGGQQQNGGAGGSGKIDIEYWL